MSYKGFKSKGFKAKYLNLKDSNQNVSKKQLTIKIQHMKQNRLWKLLATFRNLQQTAELRMLTKMLLSRSLQHMKTRLRVERNVANISGEQLLDNRLLIVFLYCFVVFIVIFILARCFLK